MKYGSKENVFNFQFHPHSKQSIGIDDWLELSLTAVNENSNILCHTLKKEINLQSIITNTTEALVVINSSDNYELNVEVFGIKEASIAVMILKSTDGSKLSAILKNTSLLPVMAKIDEKPMDQVVTGSQFIHDGVDTSPSECSCIFLFV